MWSKRIFDIVFSFAGLLIMCPFFLVISLLILLIDHETVIFKQKRVGKGGKIFYIYKFNSIKVSSSTQEGVFGKGDMRSSSTLGKVLRKTKLNELPQLYNVLKGDMSFVGPRPEVEKWVKVYPRRWKQVLKVRPGITDQASLIFMNEEFILLNNENPSKIYREIILPRKLDIYEDYLKNCCPLYDVKIIFNTCIMLLTKCLFSGMKKGDSIDREIRESIMAWKKETKKKVISSSQELVEV